MQIETESTAIDDNILDWLEQLQQATLQYWRTGFDSYGLTWWSFLLLDRTIEIIPLMSYIGVVFSFVGSLSSDRYHFCLVMTDDFKEMLTYPSQSTQLTVNKERAV